MGEGTIPAIIQANEAGIPVIEVNNRAGFGSDEAEVVTYVGADDVEFGRLQARLLDQTFGGEPVKIGYVMGIPGTSPQILRAQGFEEVLADHPEYEIVGAVTDDFDSAKALAVTQDLLTRFPEGELDRDRDAGTGRSGRGRLRAGERPRRGQVHPRRLSGRCPPGDHRRLRARHDQPGSLSAGVRGDAHGMALPQRPGGRDPEAVLPELPIITIENAEATPPAWGC